MIYICTQKNNQMYQYFMAVFSELNMQYLHKSIWLFENNFFLDTSIAHLLYLLHNNKKIFDAMMRDVPLFMI